MGNCVMCGSPIPSGQSCCSMCYGDPEYGRDDYYRQWLEEQERERLEEQEEQEEAERLAIEENIPEEGAHCEQGPIP